MIENLQACPYMSGTRDLCAVSIVVLHISKVFPGKEPILLGNRFHSFVSNSKSSQVIIQEICNKREIVNENLGAKADMYLLHVCHVGNY